MIDNQRASNADNLIGFTIRARNDILSAPARKARILKEDGPPANYSCGNRRFCDLLYIFNNGAYKMNKMIRRHNKIQDARYLSLNNHKAQKSERKGDNDKQRN
jgi:hypothetical protein